MYLMLLCGAFRGFPFSLGLLQSRSHCCAAYYPIEVPGRVPGSSEYPTYRCTEHGSLLYMYPRSTAQQSSVHFLGDVFHAVQHEGFSFKFESMCLDSAIRVYCLSSLSTSHTTSPSPLLYRVIPSERELIMVEQPCACTTTCFAELNRRWVYVDLVCVPYRVLPFASGNPAHTFPQCTNNE